MIALFSRTEQAYFHRAPVHRLVQTMAEQESLVIYIGAGASIDRTGLSWRALIDRLITKHLDESSTRRVVMDTHTPLEAASVACQIYEAYNKANALTAIRDRIKTLLYAGQGWQQGGLITSIIDLAAKLTSVGRNVYVVTTNYDSYLEEELELVNAARLGLSNGEKFSLTPRVVDHQSNIDGENIGRDATKYVSPGSIIYLHGRVPGDRAVAGVANGDNSIVLGETDYIRSQPLSSAILERLFGENALLIVGSSLVDPPLLNALANTRRSELERQRNVRQRIVVLPLQGIDLTKVLDGDSEHDRLVVSEYCSKARLRMIQFDVEPTFPDFYCQVPQLLTEIQVAIDRCLLPNRPYTASTVRYGLRLTDWWSEWIRRRTASTGDVGNPKLSIQQLNDHKALRRVLLSIRDVLNADDETLKLEVWLRWDPKSNRMLRLWASSTGTWPDFASMRESEIAANSKYASVKSFCLGRPQIYETEDASDRWLAYLCVPIRFKQGLDDFPVGVVSLASMRRAAQRDVEEDPPISRIGIWNGTKLEDVVRIMRDVGTLMFSPQPVSPQKIASSLG